MKTRSADAGAANMLRRHIEAAGKDFPTTEHLVNHLRSHYAAYARHKLRPLTKLVERIIKDSSRLDDSGGSDIPPMMNKRRKTDHEDPLVSRRKRCNSGDDASSSARADVCEIETEKNLGEKRGKGRGREDLELVKEKPKLNSIKGPMLKDLGGIDGLINELKRKVIRPFRNPEILRHYGTSKNITTGILFKGPPGCGKTTLARAIANQTGVPLYEISAAELVSGTSGASEENIRELFSKANRTAPCIVFIDEIDAIASGRENRQKGMENRIVTQLMACMDESRKLIENGGSESSNCRPSYVLVIAATNRAGAIDSALRRPGRFDREFFLGVPNENSRVQILSRLTRNVRIDGDVDIVKIARSTPGFVAADLEAVVGEAGNIAMNRILDKKEAEFSQRKEGDSVDSWDDCWKSSLSVEELENEFITMTDFEEAVTVVQPSTKREGFSDIPHVKWDDVGGHHSLRKEFDRYIINPIKSSGAYEKQKLHTKTGFLLHGPPGCGKTLIAQAVANEAGANFIYVKGPELLNKYVGETESAVRTVFERARTCAPCILFFDEMDALTPNRGSEVATYADRIVAQLLVELDSKGRKDVYVIGATNRPLAMDSALLRPGRLCVHLHVPLPSPEERGLILQALARLKPIYLNADLMAIGKDNACKNFSGADLASLIDEAVFIALEEQPLTESCSRLLCLNESHFCEALKKVSASVTDKQIQHYTQVSEILKGG